MTFAPLPRTLTLLAALTAGSLSLGTAHAAEPSPATATKAPAKAAAKPAAKPAAAAQARSAARAQELAEDTVEQVNAAQIDVAARVLTGTADCEFNQKVVVQPMEGRDAHFHVLHNKVRYTMVPRETTTGAVRLEDKRAGVVWLQIPSKSMLMNSKIGQRMVDGCTQSEQRAAVNAVQGATGIGIVPSNPGLVPGTQVPAGGPTPAAPPAAAPAATPSAPAAAASAAQ